MKNKDIVLPDTKIVYIGEPEDIHAWDISTDFHEGGNSIATIEMIDGYSIFYIVKFYGFLQHYNELEYYRELYCELTTSMIFKNYFKKFNGIRVEVKSDGNNYVLKVLVGQIFSLENYIVIIIQALIQDKTNDWVKLEIPLYNLIKDTRHQTSNEKYNCDYYEFINVQAIKFGIYSYDQKEGNFELMVRNVEVMKI